jgi:alpha/beta superfamily hydrolase
MPRKIETHMIPGPAGRLESLLEEPEDRAPREVALVCHPHPQHGGTMHNKVVYRLARGLRKTGSVVLRFNYRGVNLSEGTYDHGDGETADARAALAWLRTRYPELPFTVAGFSFGSRIALRLACEMPAMRRVLAVGFPTVYKDRSVLAPTPVRRIFIQSTHDQYGPVDELRPLVAENELHLVEAADHFFAGALDAFEETVIGLQP